MASVLERPAASAPRYDPRIDQQLAQAVGRIRAYDATLGVLTLAAVVAGYATVMIVLDKNFHLPEWVRQAGLGGLVTVVAALGYFLLVRPLTRRINPLYAAALVEHTLEDAKNRVTGYVDVVENGQAPAVVRAALSAQAARALARADLNRAVDHRGLVVAGAVLIACVLALVVLFFVFRPTQFASLATRAFVPFSSPPIATRTQITLVRPDPPEPTITAGQTITVAIHLGGKIPSKSAPDRPRVLLRHHPADPNYEELPMTEGETSRDWLVKIPEYLVQNGFWYKVAAGDAETPEYKVTVRSLPLFTDFEVEYVYPAYTRKPADRSTDPNIRAYRGTHVTLTARANRALAEAVMRFDAPGLSPVAGRATPERPDTATFGFTVTEPTRYRLFLTTTDGEKPPSPPTFVIAVDSDSPPVVQITQPEPAPTALPANGLLEVDGTIGDDFGIDKVRLRLRVDGRDLAPIPYQDGRSFFRAADASWPHTLAYKGSADLTRLTDPDGKPLTLREGQKLEYWLEAIDNCSETPLVWGWGSPPGSVNSASLLGFSFQRGQVGRSEVRSVILTAPKTADEQEQLREQKQQRQQQEQRHAADQQRQLDTEPRQPPPPAPDRQPQPGPTDQPAPKDPQGPDRQPQPTEPKAGGDTNAAEPQPRPGDGQVPPKGPQPPSDQPKTNQPKDSSSRPDQAQPRSEPQPSSEPRPELRPDDRKQPAEGMNPGTPPPADPKSQPRTAPGQQPKSDPSSGQGPSQEPRANAGEQTGNGSRPEAPRPRSPEDQRLEEDARRVQEELNRNTGTAGDAKPNPAAAPEDRTDPGQPKPQPPADGSQAPPEALPKPSPPAHDPNRTSPGQPQPAEAKPQGRPEPPPTRQEPKPQPAPRSEPGESRDGPLGGTAGEDKPTPQANGTDPSRPSPADPKRAERDPTSGSSGKPATQQPSDPGARPEDRQAQAAEPAGRSKPAGDPVPGRDQPPPQAARDPAQPDAARADDRPGDAKPPRPPESGTAKPTPGETRPEAETKPAPGRADTDPARRPAEAKPDSPPKSGGPDDPRTPAASAGQEKGTDKPADASQRPDPARTDPQRQKQIEQAVRDLDHPDPARRQAAREQLDQLIGEQNRRAVEQKLQDRKQELEQLRRDLQSSDENVRRSAEKKWEELKKELENAAQARNPDRQSGRGGRDGRPSEPSAEEIAELARKAQDLTSPDEAKRKAAEDELDRKLGRENRQRLQEELKRQQAQGPDGPPGQDPADPTQQDRARRQDERLRDTIADQLRRWGGGHDTTPPPAGEEADPRNLAKTAELQLEEFKRHRYDKNLHERLGWTQEQYEQFLKAQEERVRRLREQAAQAEEEPRPTPKQPSGPPAFRTEFGGKVETRPGNSGPASPSGSAVAPPGFDEAKRLFQEALQKRVPKP